MSFFLSSHDRWRVHVRWKNNNGRPKQEKDGPKCLFTGSHPVSKQKACSQATDNPITLSMFPILLLYLVIQQQYFYPYQRPIYSGMFFGCLWNFFLNFYRVLIIGDNNISGVLTRIISVHGDTTGILTETVHRTKEMPHSGHGRTSLTRLDIHHIQSLLFDPLWREGEWGQAHFSQTAAGIWAYGSIHGVRVRWEPSVLKPEPAHEKSHMSTNQCKAQTSTMWTNIEKHVPRVMTSF